MHLVDVHVDHVEFSYINILTDFMIYLPRWTVIDDLWHN